MIYSHGTDLEDQSVHDDTDDVPDDEFAELEGEEFEHINDIDDFNDDMVDDNPAENDELFDWDPFNQGDTGSLSPDIQPGGGIGSLAPKKVFGNFYI